MNLLSIDKLTKFAGDKELFRNLSFGFNESEKLGIIGINGSGKSTLLKILSGKEEPDSGNVYRNRILKISILEQNPDLDPDDTVLDFFYKNKNSKLKLIFEYISLLERLDTDESLLEEFDRISHEMEKNNAFEEEDRIKSLLKELGIHDFSKKISELSGGTKKKLSIIDLVVSDSNLLILDEPTNHLDIETIIWLEDFLKETDKAILIVTHDRYFLERITNRILEISLPQSILYEGNYEVYLERKAELEEAKEKQEHKEKRFLKKELEWLKRQPKARTTKQKAREDRFFEVQNKEKFQKQAEIQFKIDEVRQGKKILEVFNISKSFNQKLLFKNFEYTFTQKEKIGLVGANGAGKTTLLNILLGKLESDSGKIVQGVNTRFGYFDQNTIELNQEMRVLEYIQKKSGEYITTDSGEKISAGIMLERFQFPSRMQSQLISKLSGGEKRRLYLIQILMQNPNFLVLDEPTNDFDIKTLGVLEEFLLEFNGTVLIVSHDRYFMDRVCPFLLVLDGTETIKKFTGSYSDYLEYKSISNVEKKVNTNENSKQVKKTEQKKNKEINILEDKITELEKNMQSIEKDMITYSLDYSKLGELSNLLNLKKEELKILYSKWEEASK
jgi:ATP-binding cassette subfamily F protein uup